MNKDINDIKFIYFYSQNGTWTRIHKNLEHLGLNKNKKIGSTYARNFVDKAKKNTFIEKYKDYDVLYLDEFYDYEFDNEEIFNKCYIAMKELIENGKQIVMASHSEFEKHSLPSEEMKKEITSYDLNYNLGLDVNIKYIDEWE